ncbi:hypothetical protein N9O61_03240, partial [Octadecabacter sp.]|nr:hypothetical protein [Octadecabacter sp.]
GGWVITWVSSEQDGSGDGIYAQAYNADGTTKGGEVQVNTYTTSDQSNPQVTALNDGGWVITWQSFGQDGNFLGVYSRSYIPINEDDLSVSLTGTQQVGETLTAEVTGVDANNDTFNVIYTWSVGSQIVATTLTPTFTLTSEHAGQEVTVSVVIADLFFETAFTETATTDPIDDGNNDPTGVITLTSDNVDPTLYAAGDTISHDANALADADGLGILGTQWMRDGVAIVGATSGTYLITAADEGYDLSLVISYQDGAGFNEAVTSAAVAVEGIKAYDLEGSGADDVLYGGIKDDSLTGLGGQDILFGDDGHDSLSGGSESDRVYGGKGNDLMLGGTGNDRLYTGKGSDSAFGGDGDDYIRVGGGQESFYGGAGEDYISYYNSSGGVTINLETNSVSGSWASNDVIEGFESASGSKTGDDVITGTTGSNTIKTFWGDDVIYGGDGADRLYGGKGSDRVYGGDGDDFIRVGGGQESFYGGAGEDYISYYNSSGGVTINLETNSVSGSWASNDVIEGFENASGSKTGADVMYGTSGANRLKSFGGDDTLDGRAGNDQLYGGTGTDMLNGGAGADTLYGGADADTFHFNHGEDHDIIKDFEDDVDTIQLDGFGYADATEALTHATESDGHVVFDFGDGDMLTVENTTKALLLNDLEIL